MLKYCECSIATKVAEGGSEKKIFGVNRVVLCTCIGCTWHYVEDGETCQLDFGDMYELAPSFSELLDKLEASPYVYEIEEEKPSLFKKIFNVLKGEE